MATLPPPQSQQSLASDIEQIQTVLDRDAEGETSTDPQRGWTQEIYYKVFRMMEKCDASKRLHEESAKVYDRRHMQFSALLTVLAFVTTVVGSSADLLGVWYKYIYSVLGGVLTLSSGLIIPLRYQETATKHRAASQKFYELYQTVDFELTFPAQRSSAHHFYRFVTASFGQINGRAPRPPDSVRKVTTAPLNGVTVVGNRDDLPFVDPTSPAVDVNNGGLPEGTFASDEAYTSYITSRRPKDFVSETD